MSSQREQSPQLPPIMARAKRSIEELANKSDSDDDDYSDHPVRTSRNSTARSKATKKSRPPARKKRRQDSDDELLSDEEFLSEAEDLTDPEEEEEEDPNAARNARGLVSRRAAMNNIGYRDDSSNTDDDAEEEEEDTRPAPASRKRKSVLVTLKVGGDALKQVSGENRRTTRQTRRSSGDMYGLTNPGNHLDNAGRAAHNPEVASGEVSRRGSRSTRNSTRLAIEEPLETAAQMNRTETEMVDETTMEVQGSQLEILESDPQGQNEEGEPATDGDEQDNAQTDGDGFVPESEAGEAEADDAMDEDPKDAEDDDEDQGPITRRRSRPTRSQAMDQDAEPEEGEAPQHRRSGRKRPPRKASQRKQPGEESDFEPEEGESNDDDELSESGEAPGSPQKGKQAHEEEEDDSSTSRRPGLRRRQPRSRGQSDTGGDVAEELAEELQDLKGPRSRRRRLQQEIIYEKPRRSRKDVDYRIIRPDLILPTEEAENEITESPSKRGRGAGAGWQRTLFPTYGPFGGGGPSAILGPPGAPAATGGVDSDSSDDEAVQHPKGAGPGAPQGFHPAAQTHGADGVHGLSGTPANLGKVKDKQTLADADPLGVDVNIGFESVGGLQGHIDQLKEMVSLPLLYPEIFQRFHITPPRGVLFHGPPGTGKTLLARALANSVSSEGRKVTFYMRKGADALSKWVGEAERQLRLLFDEARKTQPSIIFFDEIDGKSNRIPNLSIMLIA